MPRDVTRGLPTQEWMSTVVGTKARGYTVTRKIAPAAGPKSHAEQPASPKLNQ